MNIVEMKERKFLLELEITEAVDSLINKFQYETELRITGLSFSDYTTEDGKLHIAKCFVNIDI